MDCVDIHSYYHTKAKASDLDVASRTQIGDNESHTANNNQSLDPHGSSSSLSINASQGSLYSDSTLPARKAAATRFAHPSLPLSLAAVKKNSRRAVELPRNEEIPIVQVFKSADVMQASMLSPRIRFRLSKLKFALNSEENW
eukprot:gene38387-50396_t